jgi:hypothetical protein
MAKKKIEIPNDMTHKLAGTPALSSYPSAPTVINVVEQPSVITTVVKKVGGRPIKATSIGRVKYTTSLTKDSIRFLRVESAMRDMSPADLLDLILTEFRKKGK